MSRSTPLALFILGIGDRQLPAAWVGPLLWLVLSPLGQWAAQASRRAYAEADQLAKSLTGRELSAPFAEPLEDGLPPLSARSFIPWLGIGGLLFLLCRVIVGLAAQLAQERPIGIMLRVSFGVFLFGNLMVLSQRLRNVWFFRRLVNRPSAFDALQRQEHAMLYWTGLATYVQAALLLLAAWLVAPNAWLLGGVLGMLLRARSYQQSLRDLPSEPAQGAS